MNKKFFIAWIVVFVVWVLGSFVVHGVLLHDDYSQLPNLMRTEADANSLRPLMFLAQLSMAGAFVWIYSRGVEPKPWLAQGMRFGVAVALLLMPMFLIYYVVQPTPGALALKQMVFEGILVIILGAVAAFFYKQPSA
jgi:hypothetical protein